MSSPAMPQQESNEETFLTNLGAFGIFLGFLLAAVVWHVLYFFVIRDCLKIQRWKSLDKMGCALDLYDHIQHNTLSNLARADGSDGIAGGTFIQDGVNLSDYTDKRTTANGLTVEVEMVPRLTSIPEGRSPNESLRTSYSNQSTSYSSARSLLSSSSSFGFSSDWRHLQVNDLWVKKKKDNSCKRFFKRLCCFWVKLFKGEDYYGEEPEWKRLKQEQLVSSHGYSFGGHNWIPKDIEGRPFCKWARGNMLTMAGSLVSAIILLIGMIMAVKEAGINLEDSLSGGGLLFLITFFKVADWFSPVLSYFGILYNDTVERGDIVEVSPMLGGVGNQQLPSSGVLNNSICGCVVDIGPSCVKVMINRSYSTLLGTSNGSVHDKFLNDAGDLTNVSGFISASSVSSYSSSSSTRNNNNKTNTTTTGTQSIGIGAGDNGDRKYIERDFMKTKMMIYVPTATFGGCTVARAFAWTPVANLQRVG
jgi:hypothetical protein